MKVVTQIAVFLDNRLGALARVCEALSEAGINICALTTSDTIDHTVLRMVVSDADKALDLFEERGTLAVDDKVLMLDATNEPGSLGGIARKLSEAKINIEYCYCAADEETKRGALIIRVSDVEGALKVLGG